jgi:hypothetical protein
MIYYDLVGGGCCEHGNEPSGLHERNEILRSIQRPSRSQEKLRSMELAIYLDMLNL